MKKHRCFGFAALPALLFFLALGGCAQPAGNENPGNETPGTETPGITYTVQTGGSAGTADSAALTLTFSEPVALEAGDITLTKGTGSVSAGALAGSGANWTLALSVERPGGISLAITKTGVESGGKALTVHKAGALRFETVEALAEGIGAITGSSASAPFTAVLGPEVNITAQWAAIDAAVNGAYLVLDLGNCAAEGNTITRDTANTGLKNNQYVKGLILPDTLTAINIYTFQNWSHLARVSIPAKGTRIGRFAFNGCGALTDLAIETGAVIEEKAFLDCTALVNITIGPGEYTEMGGSAFKGCSALESITLPEGIITIGSWAFADCSKLARVSFPETLALIGTRAFSGCSALTGLSLPAGLEAIASAAFFGCTALTGITIPAGVTAIGGSTFSGCTGLTGISLPPGLTRIDQGAFSRCSSLTAVALPAGITFIGPYAFSDCTGLANVVIPSGVSVIDRYTFEGCSSLAGVTIPQKCGEIREDAFKDCAVLSSVVFLGSRAAIFNDAVFPGTGTSLKAAYEAASSKAGTYTRNGEHWNKSL